MINRENQLCALGDFDPGKIEQLRRLPIIDYYLHLNARIEQNKKVAQERKKK